MPSGIKHAAVLPPQFTGKAFLLEVREPSVYTPSQIDYPYLYCKRRQHVIKSHRVKQFQTPAHGQGVSFTSHAAQPSAFITDITEFSAACFFVCAYSCGISRTIRKTTAVLQDLRELEDPQGFLKVWVVGFFFNSKEASVSLHNNCNLFSEQ